LKEAQNSRSLQRAEGDQRTIHVARLFISHSSLNNGQAVEVRNWLAENGWDDIFLDLDPERGIVAGQRWKEALQKVRTSWRSSRRNGWPRAGASRKSMPRVSWGRR
jgi:hypothetical protein